MRGEIWKFLNRKRRTREIEIGRQQASCMETLGDRRDKTNVIKRAMPSEIRIYLDNPNNYYHPGHTITGKVESILVKFKGKCSTSWTERESYYDDFFKEDRTRDVSYSGEEEYFNREFNLTGNPQRRRGNNTLSPGKHVYPFSYQLPQNIPTSYEDPNGWANVRYTVQARIDRPWKFDIESVAVFNVMSPLDLNSIPRITEPVELSVDKVLCSCWCNNNDALTFTFTLPTTGYVPGQNVKIGVYVQNLTNVNVDRVKFKISQFVEYTVNTPSTRVRNCDDVVVDCYDGGIGAHGEKSWTATLLIPLDKSFPNMKDCNLIRITYRLKGVALIPYPHTNLSAFVPLTIGHIPLVGGNFNVTLGPPVEMERLPYIDATAPPSDNTSLVTAFGNRNNYGAVYNDPTTPNGGQDLTAPPTYEETLHASARCN
ncbi:hypothetical protein RI129_013195 [Pyrocoelia pectoralis]|uniref:Arrestin C-terminal-like domain-containing protein n=1 Tax=Pyrocoelia pectoralis TaxID=417401 RepID=A0AAN7Z7I0_9COLE